MALSPEALSPETLPASTLSHSCRNKSFIYILIQKVPGGRVLPSIPILELAHTRSATVPSILWKNIIPPTSSTTTATADAASNAPGACPWPVNAQRNPSITPAIGFNPYNQRHLAGTRLLGYATGDASIQNCTRNGITYCTSRYIAFNAESHNPTPSAVASASSSKNGNQIACTPGRNPYPSVIANSTANAIAKSTRPESTLERGRINRGKYTFVTTRWFATTTFVVVVNAV